MTFLITPRADVYPPGGDPGGEGDTLGGGGRDPGEEGETLGCYSQCTEENVWRVLKNNIQVFLAIIFASFVH